MNNKQYSLKYFQENAAQWDTQPRHLELTAAITTAIGRQIPLNNTLHALEYGCGTGLLSLLMADQLAQITAIDI